MKKRFSRSATLFFACAMLVLAGCVHLPEAASDYYWIKPGQAQPSGRAASLLLYFDYAHNLSAADFSIELEHLQQLAADDHGAYRTLQYSLALSLPGGDTKKAQQLIGNVSVDTDPELSALAALIRTDLAERQRLEADATKRGDAEAKRADTEGRRADTEARRAETEGKRAEAEIKRADELQKKLDALMNIEKNLIERKKARGEKP
jgi:hypothetical protein